MSYMQPFESMVTTSKRNNIYYGPTESYKMHSSFTEILSDLNTIYYEIQTIANNLDILASGYLLPSGASWPSGSLYDLRRQVYDFEERFNRRIYVQANQVQVLE